MHNSSTVLTPAAALYLMGLLYRNTRTSCVSVASCALKSRTIPYGGPSIRRVLGRDGCGKAWPRGAWERAALWWLMTRVGSALPVEQKREVGCGRVVGTSRGGAGKWSYCCGRMGSGRSHWGFGCGAKGDRRIVALLHRSQDLSRQHSALYGCYTNNTQARGYGVHQSRDACEQ